MADGTGTKAAKLVGEGFFPGVSLVLDGDIKGGTIHLVGGAVGLMVFGPGGWIYAAVDSYSKAQTGRHLHQHFFTPKTATPTPPPTPPSTPNS